jgi:choline monooxygenase
MKYEINPDIAQAKTLPADFYSDASAYRRAIDKVFAPSWQLAGDLDAILKPGFATPVTLLEGSLNEPLALVSDKEGKLRCLSNVCTHRGALLIEKPCTLNDIRCRYHGRRFSLDGTFQSMPEFKEVKNFPTESDHLARLPVFTWGKWIFTSAGQPKPAEQVFGDMMKRVAWLPLEKFVLHKELSRDYIVNAHWALYTENYLEGFHIPFVHPGLNQVIDYNKYTTELFRYSNVQIGIAKENEPAFDLPQGSPDHGKKVGGYYFWVFPNLMFNFYPWGASINIVKPLGPGKTLVSFLTYVADASRIGEGAGSGLDKVEMEDEAVVESVQRGVRSRFYRHGRYSVTRETGTHHFHRLISEFMNE